MKTLYKVEVTNDRGYVMYARTFDTQEKAHQYETVQRANYKDGQIITIVSEETPVPPTVDQFQKLIGNFDKVLPRAENDDALDMQETRVVTKEHPCGTVHCHAGWYAVAQLDSELQEQFDRILQSGFTLGSSKIDFMVGVDLIAKHLGFTDGPHHTLARENLLDFFDKNDDLWGNRYASIMFGSSKAFGNTRANNLKDIRNHWVRVRNRCHPEAAPLAEV